MKHLILSVLSLTSLAAWGVTPDRISDLTALLAGGTGQGTKETAVKMMAMAKGAPPAERAAVEKLAKLMEGMESSSENSFMNTHLAIADVVREILKDPAADADAQSKLITTLFLNGVSLEKLKGGEAKGGAMKVEAKMKIEALLNKFPESAAVHFVAGDIFSYFREGKKAQMEYAKCLELEPRHSGCTRSASEQAKFESRPRCSRGSINPALMLLIGSSKAESDRKHLVKFEGKTFFVDRSPIWTGRDVEEMEQNEREVTFQGTETTHAKEAIISMKLNKAAAKRFDEATEHNIGRFGVLMLGTDVLMAPQIRERIDGGYLNIELGIGKPIGDSTTAMKRLCTKLSK